MAQKPAQTRSRHGLTVLKARVMVRGLKAIDGRTAAAQALFAWKRELLTALGGQENVSPQRMAIVDMAVRTRLFVDHVDSFLLAQKSLVDKRKRAILPILRERTQLIDSLARLLSQLGLDRVPKPVPTLTELLQQHEAERMAPAMGSPEAETGRADDFEAPVRVETQEVAPQ